MFQLRHLLLLLLLSTAPLSAKDHFAKLFVSYDQLEDADFKNPETPGDSMGYTQADARLLVNIPLQQCYGAQLYLGWGNSTIDWAENPYFSEKTYGYIDFGIGGYTFVIPNWKIVATVAASIDTDNSGSDYMLYKGLLWAQYCYENGYFCDTSLHFGLIGTSGLEETYLLPIIGFAATPYPGWRLSVVFPMDMSLSYMIYNNTSAYVGMRGYRRRHRLSEEEPVAKGVWLYRNIGTELGIRYNNCCWLEGNLHVGITWEGDLKVMDPNGEAINHVKSKSTLYAGVSASVGY